MKQLRKYVVYLEDEEFVYKVYVPAENEQGAKDFCQGNGEVLLAKDITETMVINNDDVEAALLQYGFTADKIQLIKWTLQTTGIAD